MKHKVWETIKVVLIVVLLTVGVGGGWFYAMHHSSSQPSTTKSKSNTGHPSKPTKSNLKLVAFGDSLTQGVGDQAKAGGYVSQIKQRLQQKQDLKVSTANFGHAGDRSDQILTHYQSSAKFRQAVKQADVLVLTVGGNDLVQTLERNVTSTSTKKTTAAVAQAQATYVTHLQALVKTIRQANPKAPLFCFGIYNPVYVYFTNVTQLQSYISHWNQQTQAVLANTKQSYFVDINHALSVGQYQSQSAQKQLKQAANQANAGKLTSSSLSAALKTNVKANRYISSADNFHPNHAGYRIMTDKLYQVMLAHPAWKYR